MYQELLGGEFECFEKVNCFKKYLLYWAMRCERMSLALCLILITYLKTRLYDEIPVFCSQFPDFVGVTGG